MVHSQMAGTIKSDGKENEKAGGDYDSINIFSRIHKEFSWLFILSFLCGFQLSEINSRIH